MNGELELGVEPHNGNGDENQRYTIRRAVDWARKVSGVTMFDLDVAACAEAHHAPVWYDRATDGLKQPWFGNVWCNPPWNDIEPWVEKAWGELDETDPRRLPLWRICMLLPGNRTHRPWWQTFVEPFRDGPDVSTGPIELRTRFAPERFPYGGPGNPEAIGTPEPNFTSVLLVWRRVADTSGIPLF